MFNNSFVAAIKSNGKILREFDKDAVYLKFGSEYSILLKNLENRRAVAKIFIDGQEVSSGGFVIDSKSEIEIERFVRDLSQGNRFKFIEKTAGIESHRGNKLEDGLIRVEFEFEQVRYPSYVPDKVYYRSPDFYGMKTGDTLDCKMIGGGFSSQHLGVTCSSTYSSGVSAVRGLNDAGITVPGSISDQKFTEVRCDTDGIKHTMIFRVLGSADGEPVKQAVTVTAKPKCVTCGKVNKATSKFCSSCGTSLQIV